MIDRRNLIKMTAVSILLTRTAASKAQAVGDIVHQTRPHDIVIGDDKAPVKIVEYASLTCPHCAAFNREVFPKLKTLMIDKGKLKFIWRNFPLDNLAVAAAIIERSQPESSRYAIVDLILQRQNVWMRAGNSLDGLKEVLKQAGINSADIDNSIRNQKALDDVLADRSLAIKEYSIEATPTFFINKRKYVGEMRFDEIEKISENIILHDEAGK